MSDLPPMSARLTGRKVRRLSALDLGRHSPEDDTAAPPVDEINVLDDDDPILLKVRGLLETYGGVIFVGTPGTSKSYYAARVGLSLVDGDRSRLRLVQFHPSYQYEDFVEGYVPRKGATGFDLEDKHFALACKDAKKQPIVIVIDELSRGDPGRVFGEALTYLERSKRNITFSLASGSPCTVPSDLIILATMNPHDRGVDEVDAALDRRFAKIAMDPDAELLNGFLTEAGMADELKDRVLTFFRIVNARTATNPFVSLGHTYFIGVSDVDGLRRLWEHQLRFHFEKAYRIDPDGRADIFRLWDRVLGVRRPEGAATDEASTAAGEAPVA